MNTRIAAIATAALLTVLTGCATTGTAPETMTTGTAIEAGQVTKVSDGDTIHVLVAGHDEDVRALSVDTPETHKPGVPVQCYGIAATTRAHQLLDGQTVQLHRDPTQADRDRYGRVLRYVTLPDGRDYSLTTVADGYGRAYKLSRGPAPQDWPQIVVAQQQAQTAKRGLWGPRPAGCDGGA